MIFVRSLVVSIFIAAYLFPGAGATVFGSDEPTDPIKANSVWKGECVYDPSEYFPEKEMRYLVILHIKQRKGIDFDGTAWYPTLNNGLLKVKGRVGPKGAVTFTETAEIYGRATAEKPGGVLAGMKFKVQLDQTTMKGRAEWTGPSFNEVARATISLKRAH
jgi:hypothetical protein